MSNPTIPKRFLAISRPGGRSNMISKYRAVSEPKPVPEDEKPSLESFNTLSSLTDPDGLDDIDLGPRERGAEPGGALRRWLRRARRSNWIWLAHTVLLVTAATLFTLAALVRSSTLKHVQEFSAWSPAAAAVKYNQVKYNITTNGNRFVGAGPEVDKAWREISYDVGDQWIPRKDLARLDMPPTSLTVDNPKTGEAGYRIGLEVFHQLHCLNLLRKVTYKEYYSQVKGELAVKADDLQGHTDHCLEVLRLSLTCSADVGAFTFYLQPGDPLPWPELNSKHKCRNFDGIRQWAMDNSVGNMEHL